MSNENLKFVIDTVNLVISLATALLMVYLVTLL